MHWSLWYNNSIITKFSCCLHLYFSFSCHYLLSSLLILLLLGQTHELILFFCCRFLIVLVFLHFNMFDTLLLTWWVLYNPISCNPGSSTTLMFCYTNTNCIPILNFPLKIDWIISIYNSSSISADTNTMLVKVNLFLPSDLFFKKINIICMYIAYLNNGRQF